MWFRETEERTRDWEGGLWWRRWWWWWWGGSVFEPFRHFIRCTAGVRVRRKKEREREKEREPMMECSHSVDPALLSGRKAGDR